MALTSMISLAITDDGGNRDTMRVFVPATATLLEIQALVDALAPLVDAVTGGVLNSATVTLGLTLPAGLKAAAVADSLKTTGANFSYVAENTNYRHTVRVPAIDPALITAGQLDTADAAVIALRDGLINGTVALDPSDEYANDLITAISQELSFRTK